MAGFNISEFSSKLGERGIARNNLFGIQIELPKVLQAELSSNMDFARDLKFFCKSVTLPEMDLTTADIQHQGFGAVSRRPQSLTFPIMPATFMVDSEFQVMKLFHRWMQTIINYDTSGGRLSGSNNQLPYEMGYKKEYSTTMRVAVYSHNTDEIEYVYKFSGLYPVQVGNVSPSWENNNDVLQMAVGLTYDEVSVTGAKQGLVLGDRKDSFSGGLLSWFSTINSFAQAIENLDRPRDIQDAINTINDVNRIGDFLKKF